MPPAAFNTLTLEEQLVVLSSCGITLRKGVTIDDLLYESSEREGYEQSVLLLIVHLGGEQDYGQNLRFSDQLWHFDTECIYDHGSYAQIAERMRDLAYPHLPLTDISDYVNVEEGRAELSFKINEKAFTWKMDVDDDWVDPSIWRLFVNLLAEQTKLVRYTYLDLGGQDFMIGIATEEQRTKLNEATGLNFVYLY